LQHADQDSALLDFSMQSVSGIPIRCYISGNFNFALYLLQVRAGTIVIRVGSDPLKPDGARGPQDDPVVTLGAR
jgi:hypothetical protein